MTYLVLGLAAAFALALAVSYYWADRLLTGDTKVPLTVGPAQFGLAFEPVAFENPEGMTLRGWWVPAAVPSRRSILLCHGWSANKGEILKTTGFLSRRGFNLLYFDFRACGESDGDMLSVGHLEAADFDAAADYLRARRPEDSLGAYGLSMGSMVVFCGLARRRFFKAAVLECLFASHDEAVVNYARDKYPAVVPLAPLGLWWVRARLGADPQERSPERLAPTIDGTPLLAVYGAEDRLATPEMGRRLAAKVKAPLELWVVPGAAHAKCAEAAGAAYEARLASFYGGRL